MKELEKLSDKELMEELTKRNQKKEENKQAFKELMNNEIPHLFQKLKDWSEQGEALKAEIYEGLKTSIELKFEVYNTRTNQKSHTFTSDKGESITIGYHTTTGYDDTVFIGISKVKEYIDSLIKDEYTAKLIKQINNLLKRDKKGDLDPKKVVELRQMTKDFNDANFIEGVEIIENAYQPKRSAWYIQASFKNEIGVEQNLPLSIASMEFPKGFDLNFLIQED